MIVDRVPSALNRGDTVFVPWPDWLWRRATVVGLEPLDGAWRIVVRWVDGDDQGLQHSIVRGAVEPLPVVVKSELQGTLKTDDPLKARTARRHRQREREITAEDEELAAEYLSAN